MTNGSGNLVVVLQTERDEWAKRAVSCLEQAIADAADDPIETVAIFRLTRSGDRIVTYSSVDKNAAVGGLVSSLVALAQVG